MITIATHTMELKGTNYEIGYQMGKRVAEIPPLYAVRTQVPESFGDEQTNEAISMLNRWCPGLVDELHGFADALNVSPQQLSYYFMTYLVPRCSQIALSSAVTKDGKPLLARNYEFNHETEDFCLVRTSVTGKYTHMGTSVMNFGRDDGFNEHGLVVTMSSCGFPVGALPFMRAPKLKGLQFWAVIRSLLENCKDVEDALAYLIDMPIAYNLNLMLMDKNGNAALFETLDGHSAVQRIGAAEGQSMLCATNHPVLPELIPMETQAMVHSVRRYNYIHEQLDGHTDITGQQLKDMLLSKYPNGLCCHYYEEFFGTTKSMVFSPVDGTLELCWGGRSENGWNIYDIHQPLTNATYEIQIALEKAAPKTYGWQPMV